MRHGRRSTLDIEQVAGEAIDTLVGHECDVMDVSGRGEPELLACADSGHRGDGTLVLAPLVAGARARALAVPLRLSQCHFVMDREIAHADQAICIGRFGHATNNVRAVFPPDDDGPQRWIDVGGGTFVDLDGDGRAELVSTAVGANRCTLLVYESATFTQRSSIAVGPPNSTCTLRYW